MRILDIIAKTSDVIQDGVNKVGGDEAGNVETFATDLINMVIYAVGIIAIGLIVFSGVQYSLSQGEAAKTKKAKDTMLYAIIGLVIAILAFVIVNFVLTSVF